MQYTCGASQNYQALAVGTARAKTQDLPPPQGVPAAGHRAQPGAETRAIGKAPPTSASGPALPPPAARP